MSEIEVIRPHALAQDEASRRIERALKEKAAAEGFEYVGPQPSADGMVQFNIAGKGAKAILVVTTKDVRVEVTELPWAARLVKGTVQEAIERRIDEALAAPPPGERIASGAMPVESAVILPGPRAHRPLVLGLALGAAALAFTLHHFSRKMAP